MRGAFAIVPAAGGLAAKSLLKHMPALATVMKTVTKPVDDAIKPIKSTVQNIALSGKQSVKTAITKTQQKVSTIAVNSMKSVRKSVEPVINEVKQRTAIKAASTKSGFSTKVENAIKLGKTHVDQLKFAVAHPILSTVTSKVGQKSIRGTAKFIDDALRPAHIKSMEVIGGPKIPVGIERGPSKDVLKNKGEDLISKMQAGKDALLNKKDPKKFDSFATLMNKEDATRYNQFWDKTEINMNTQDRVATNSQSPNSFVNSILPKKLKEHNLSYDDFTNLRLKPDYQLNETELKIIQDIRNSVVRPDSKTPLIKNIHANDIQKYLDGKYTTVRGFIAKAEDSAHIHDYNHVRESMRLDYSYYDDFKEQIVRPYPEDGNAYGYIEFKAKNTESLSPEILEIPYGVSMNHPFSGWKYNEWPWTGNGFTSSRNGEVIPEWTANKEIIIKKGAKLHRVIDGRDEVIAIFDGETF
ncbi:hypothetical protein [Rummeliibacillus sp. POC4]|nr:hypothetical protein [Rummeliibacillus sp. POC4]RIJ63575.1 hypothetical protein D1606_14335 [Rummeliibacillus sp. POC4]